MSALKVMIVDDEPLVRERLRALVSAHADLDVVAEATDGIDALNRIHQHCPDLLFLDVEMPELGGFGVIAALDPAKAPGVVFVTAYEQYALSAFDAGAIDYLLKPITPERFVLALERARRRLTERTPSHTEVLVQVAAALDRANRVRARYVVRQGDSHHVIPVHTIDWIDTADNYLRLHVGGKTYLARGTMKQAEQELDSEKFIRIHRSALVAADGIVSVARRSAGWYVVHLRDGTRLRTSRQYLPRISALVRSTR